MRAPLLIALALLALAAPLAADGPPWIPLGPGGGHVGSLALHPTNPNVLYAATGGVVYRSVNGGASWVEGAGPVGVIEVALDPSRPTTVYALSSRQLFKSVNGGASWTSSVPVVTPPASQLGHLAVDPAQPSRLYLSAGGGVWRSDNGGASWRRFSQGLPGSEITALAVPRRPSGTAFAGTRLGGLYRTTNAGRSWMRLGRGLPAERVLALAVSPSDPRTVYASLEHGLFLSRDGGATWTEVTAPDNVPPSVLTVHPRLPRTLFATGQSGIVKSTDFARSWTPIGPSPGVDVRAIAVHSGRSGDALYLGLSPQGLDAGGVLLSTDGGERWTVRNRGLHELLATDVAAGAEDALLAGLFGQGLFRLINPQGPLWARTHAGFPPSQEHISVGEIVNAGPGIFLATVFSTSPATFPLHRTTDGGRTWSQVTALADPVMLAADPGVAGTAYALTREGLFRTVDAGASWTPLTPPPLSPSCPFSSLAVAPSSPPGARVLYAAGRGAADSCGLPLRVFRSADGGASWVDVEAGLSAVELVAPLVVDPLDANVLYGGTGSDANRDLSLWKSVDGGATWARTGAPRGRVRDLVVPPIPGRVYAVVGTEVTRVRVLRSDDGGATWRPWNEGLRGEIHDLALDPGDPGRLYVATDRGVWMLVEEE